MKALPDDCAREVLEVVPLIMRAIRAEMRSHRGPDLSLPQFRVLAFLSHHQGASLSDVAEHIGLTLPSMSKAIDGLVRRELVTRQVRPEDRRCMALKLTEGGQTMLESARAATQAYLGKLLATLPASERATVAQAMQLLHPIFAALPGPERKASE